MMARRGAKNRLKNPTFDMKAQVGNTDLAMIQALHSAWGGSVRLARKRTERTADSYYWEIAAIQAANMLRRIEPYLITKKHLARLCVEFQDRMTARVGRLAAPGHPISEEEVVVRTNYFNKVRELNDISRKWLKPEQPT